MINKADIPAKVNFTRDLIEDQIYDDLHPRWNTSDTAFSETEGLGSTNGSSTLVIVGAGGFDDQRIVADMKFVAATAAGNENIGVLCRLQSIETPDQTYYQARVNGGFAQIIKVVDASTTTLASTAFTLDQDEVVTIDFSVVGDQLTASFDVGEGPTNLAAVDSDIPSRGLMAFRSLNSTVYCRSLTAEQL